jgi:hypothetical protein
MQFGIPIMGEHMLPINTKLRSHTIQAEAEHIAQCEVVLKHKIQ